LTYVVLTVWPGLKSLIIPKKDKVGKVRRKAESDFFRHHVAATKGGTGVLVYISRFERRVELLVDAGIAAKIPQDTWKSVVDGVIAGIKGPDLVKDLCAQIVRIGETLSKDFPRRADDVNELPDRPVVEVP
jgi:putative membrane protein